MAKTYTRTYYDQPSISLSLVSGGSLAANTTYYYRAMTVFGNLASRMDYVSAPSDVQSITTDATNRTINIAITHASGNAEYTIIWVHEGSDPGIGYWADKANYPNIYQLANTVNPSMYVTGYPNKISSYSDTGTRTTYTRLGASNYNFYIPRETSQDLIAVSGGTEEDPITLEDIYQYALANGWPLDQTIERVDYGIFGAGDDSALAQTAGRGYGRPTYIIHAKELIYGDYLKIMDCNVISFLQEFRGLTNSVITMGSFQSEFDHTYDGVDWTTFTHASQNGRFSFRNAKIYDTKFRGRRMGQSVAQPYGHTFNSVVDSGFTSEYVDVTASGDLNNGMSLTFTTGGDDNIVRRVNNYQNRWEWSPYYAIQGNIEAFNFYVWSSGPWPRTTKGEDEETTLIGTTLELVSPTGRLLYANSYVATRNQYTMLNLVNAVVKEANWDQIYWFVYGGETYSEDVAFVKRQYTVDLQVMDEEGTAIEGATATLVDRNGTEVFSETTDANGEIDEQVVTHTLYQHSLTLTTSHLQPDGRTTTYGPFTLTVTKADYNDYTHTLDIEEASSWVIGMKLAGEGYADKIDVELADTAIDVEVVDDDISLTVDDGIYLTVDDDEIDVVIDTLEITVSE